MHLKRLLHGDKDWDVAVIYVHGRNPIVINKDYTVKDDGVDTIVVNTPGKTHLPWEDTLNNPMVYTLQMTFSKSDIISVDYYLESKILSVS